MQNSLWFFCYILFFQNAKGLSHFPLLVCVWCMFLFSKSQVLLTGRMHLWERARRKTTARSFSLVGWPSLTRSDWAMPCVTNASASNSCLPPAATELQWNRSWSTLTGKIIFGFTTKLKLYWIHSNPSYIHICLDYQAGTISVRRVETLKKYTDIRRWNTDTSFFPNSQAKKKKKNKTETDCPSRSSWKNQNSKLYSYHVALI